MAFVGNVKKSRTPQISTVNIYFTQTITNKYQFPLKTKLQNKYFYCERVAGYSRSDGSAFCCAPTFTAEGGAGARPGGSVAVISL